MATREHVQRLNDDLWDAWAETTKSTDPVVIKLRALCLRAEAELQHYAATLPERRLDPSSEPHEEEG